jgi:hypothetical protein
LRGRRRDLTINPVRTLNDALADAAAAQPHHDLSETRSTDERAEVAA